MKKQAKSYIFYMGIIVFAVGLLLEFLIPASDGAFHTLPFVLTGFGAGIIGVGVVSIFRKRMIDNNPQKQKSMKLTKKMNEISGFVKKQVMQHGIQLFLCWLSFH